MFARTARRFEEVQWMSRKLAERRLELFGEMAPLLNELFCFFRLVGDFRRVTPPRALEIKRDLDRVFHINRYLFSEKFRTSHELFMDRTFQIFVAYNQLALIRTSPEQQRLERGDNWREEWGAMFSPSDERRDPVTIGDAYNAVMKALADDVRSPANP
jgi:hypothetical protein